MSAMKPLKMISILFSILPIQPVCNPCRVQVLSVRDEVMRLNRTTICRLQMLKRDHHTPYITSGLHRYNGKENGKTTILNPKPNTFSSPPSPAPEITGDRCSLVIVRVIVLVIVTVIGVLSVIVTSSFWRLWSRQLTFTEMFCTGPSL